MNTKHLFSFLCALVSLPMMAGEVTMRLSLMNGNEAADSIDVTFSCDPNSGEAYITSSSFPQAGVREDAFQYWFSFGDGGSLQKIPEPDQEPEHYARIRSIGIGPKQSHEGTEFVTPESTDIRKIIRQDNHVYIIRNGEKYDLTGRKL